MSSNKSEAGEGRTSEKHERQGDFADDENVAQAISGGTCGGVAASVAQERGLILACELKSRREAEENAGENGNGDGEGEHVEIERDDGFVGNRVFGQESDDGFDAPVGEEHAEGSAGDARG